MCLGGHQYTAGINRFTAEFSRRLVGVVESGTRILRLTHGRDAHATLAPAEKATGIGRRRGKISATLTPVPGAEEV